MRPDQDIVGRNAGERDLAILNLSAAQELSDLFQLGLNGLRFGVKLRRSKFVRIRHESPQTVTGVAPDRLLIIS